MKNILSVLLCTMTCLPPAGIFAGELQPPKPEQNVLYKTITPVSRIDELIAAALEHSPGVAALRARLSASKERVTSSTALPDPTLGFTVLGQGLDRLDPYSYLMIDYRQELPYPGKRDARKASAEAESEIRKSELEDLKRRLVAQIRIQYALINALDSEQRLLNSSNDLLELLQSTASARYSAGKSDQETLIKIQLEATRNRERLSEIHAERRMASSMINRLVAGDTSVNLPSIESLPVVSLPVGDPVELALKQASDITIKKAELKLAEKKAFEAGLSAKPDFGVGGGLGAGASPMPMVLLKFDMSLPVWNGTKQEPEIRAAAMEVEAARSGLKESENTVRSEVERLLAQWQADEELVKRYREASIPQSKAAMDAAVAGYMSGTADFSLIIEDFRNWLDASTQLARREADRYSVWAQLEVFTTASPDTSAKGGNQ